MRRSVFIALGLFVAALAFRLPDLGAFCHIDGTQHWFGRTLKFWTALSAGRAADTFYSPHPGVTLMWLSGASLKLFGVLGLTNERAIVAATLPSALLSAALSPLSYVLLRRVIATVPERRRFEPVPLLTALLLATEPFLVGNARTYHMDSLMTGFMWLAALAVVLCLLERRRRWAVLAGACLALSVLTRMATALFAVSVVLPFAAAFLCERRPRTKTLPWLLALTGVTTLLVTYFGWPALTLHPRATLLGVLTQSSELVERGHRMFGWGRVHPVDPGFTYYVGALLMRLSPEVLLGTLGLFALEHALPRRFWRVLAVIAATYLPYTLAVWLGSKKSDRYLLFLWPPLVLFASVVAADLAWRLKTSARFGRYATIGLATLAGLFVIVRVVRLALVHPMPIAWCAGYPGLRCEDVITIGGGEGFRDTARWISEHASSKRPKVLSAYMAGEAMRPWLDFQPATDGAEAEFIVTYIASDQRQIEQGIRAFALGAPLHEVGYDGRVYTRIYRGPSYRSAAK